ncbi:MAG: type II toxin-antitoxin system Phd/YefM family antitoxin [Deltaproteobacteria bacterium]|nr:type II toxin-antitoxin system Phd/YefM family antitoxin [Deltaproteobacteria bacterium]
METIAISQFKATCLKLLERVKNTGESLVVTKKGVPIAMVAPPPKPPVKRSSYGCMKDSVTFIGDIVSPLGTDDWEVFKE